MVKFICKYLKILMFEGFLLMKSSNKSVFFVLFICFTIFLLSFLSLTYTNTSTNIKTLYKEDLSKTFFTTNPNSQFTYIEDNTLKTKYADNENDENKIKNNPNLFFRDIFLNDNEELFLTFTISNHSKVVNNRKDFLYVDLFSEDYDKDENQFRVNIQKGKKEIRRKLHVEKNHPKNLKLRFFTYDNLELEIYDIAIWKYVESNRMFENICFSLIMAIISFFIIKFQSTKSSKIFFIIFMVINIIFLCILLNYLNTTPRSIIGDEAGYISQALSFSHDFDNEYTDKDLVRYLLTINKIGPAGAFVNFYKGKYYFSKTMLYGLSGSFSSWFFGVNGLEVFNFMCFLGIIIVGYLFLKRRNNKVFSFIFSLLFSLLSVSVAYIFESFIDLYNVFILGITFLVFTKYLDNPQKNIFCFYLSAILFGILGYSRTPYIPFAFFCGLKLLFDKKVSFKKTCLFGILFCLSFGAFSLYHIIRIGCYSPYGGERYNIRKATCEMVSPLNNSIIIKKEILEYLLPMSISEGGIVDKAKIAISDQKAFWYNMLCYFIGWQTGALIYFPCLFLVLFNLRRKDLFENLYIIFGIAGHIMFFMLQGYDNYYGGSHSLGNRYFLQILLPFLFLVPTISLKRTILGGLVALFGFFYFLDTSMNLKLRDTADFRTKKELQILPKEYTQFHVTAGLTSSRKLELGNDSYIWLGSSKTNYLIENKETNSYWTKGKLTQNLLVVTKNPVDSINFNVSSGPIDNEIKTSDKQKIEFKKDSESKIVKVNLVLKHKFYHNYYYEFSFKPKYYFIPKEMKELKSNDVRKLGVNISKFKLNFTEE